MLNTTLTSTLIASVLWAGFGHEQSTDSLEASTLRFYRASDGLTVVDGFVRIPFGLLSVLGTSGSGAYRLQMSVFDGSGLELTSTEWTSQVPGHLLSISGASTVEHFSFAVPSGGYGVRITVTDSASGAPSVLRHEMNAFGDRPFASDLLLTNSMRRSAGEGDSPAPGEIQKGSLFLSGTTRPILSPSDANLFYYMEHYPGQDVTVSAVARIRSDGRNVVETPPSEIPLSSRGGVTARSLDLTGLPPGDYEIQLEVTYPDTSITRQAPFTVSDFRQAETLAPNDPFAFQTEATLDSLYAPLVYLLEGDERGVYGDLSVEGKRNFMRQFWGRRDPTPRTPENEARNRYYQAIAEANHRYHEGGAAAVPGWRTDRGRIFLKYGEPDEFLQRPSSGRNPPFVVWKFTRGRPLKFLFIDQSGFGHWELIYSDDRSETTRGDWQSFLEQQSVDEVLRF
ncbi:MAG: GWxTD domain-containing protein [Gemmatimonadales bacterium]